MRRNTLVLLLIALLCISSIGFTACGAKSSSDSEIDSTDEQGYEVFEEEIEGAEITKQKAPVEDFYGTWITTSSQAELYYGDMEITINDDQTWSGTITGDDYSGSWQTDSDGITIHCDLFDFYLYFNDQGHLILEEPAADPTDAEDLSLITVLSRK